MRAPAVSPPAVLAPDVREDAQRRSADLVDVEAARLAAPVRARLAEAGSDRDHDRVLAARRRELELAPLGDRALMDVAGEDEVGAGLDESRRARGSASRRASCASATAPRAGGDAARRSGSALAGTSRKAPRPAAPARRAHAPTGCRQGRTELSPATTSVSERYTGSVVSHCRSNSAQGRVNRRGNEYGCRGCRGSPAAAARDCGGRPTPARAGCASRGGSNRRSRSRDPGASSTSLPSASIDSGLSFLPKCRSERWRTRVGTAA